MAGYEKLRDIDPVTGLEMRPRTMRHCPQSGCDWYLVTSHFIGGPHRVREVSQAEQQRVAGLHMREHFPPPKTYFT